jgi:hypothetical protein
MKCCHDALYHHLVQSVLEMLEQINILTAFKDVAFSVSRCGFLDSSYFAVIISFPVAQQPLVCHSVFMMDASRSHSGTSYSVGLL